MANMQVNQAQAGQKLGEDLKTSGRSALDGVRKVRNIAAGTAAAGLAAMGAEAVGVVTLPAEIPTAMLTLVAGSVAATTSVIVAIGDKVDHLINDSAQRQQLEQLEAAGK